MSLLAEIVDFMLAELLPFARECFQQQLVKLGETIAFFQAIRPFVHTMILSIMYMIGDFAANCMRMEHVS